MAELIVNRAPRSVKAALIREAKRADRVDVFVAFLTSGDLIETWLGDGKQVNLYVGLQFPTSPEILQGLYTRCASVSYFPECRFHTKMYLFYRRGRLFSAVVGSSNLTEGGLKNNVEANIVCYEDDVLRSISVERERLQCDCDNLDPSTLRRYSLFIQEHRKELRRVAKTMRYRLRRKRKQTTQFVPSKTTKRIAERYLQFWRFADEIVRVVTPMVIRAWPGFSPYLAIDHFWHWLKAVRKFPKKGASSRDLAWRRRNVPTLFREYIRWANTVDRGFREDFERRRRFIGRVLAPSRIVRLTASEAKEVYRLTHSGANRATRFGSDEKLISENGLSRVRDSFQYLFDPCGDFAGRLAVVLDKRSRYHLRQIGPSVARELVGWSRSSSHPICNAKAENAASRLGFRHDS